MRLITPEAGSHKYPDTVLAERRSQPEVFTSWVFIFNNPEKCTTFPGEAFPCGGADFNDIAPHGQFDAATMPAELSTPVGNPTCDCWWVATFSADA